MNILLGFSEGQLSRVTDVLFDYEQPNELLIVQNIELPSQVPFCSSKINFKLLQAADWNKTEQDRFLFAVSKPAVKKAVYDYFLQNKQVHESAYRNLIHPSAIISETVTAGNGLFVEPNTVIASFTKLGFAVTVNRLVSIGHHCSIGNFVTINPGVHIAGHCTLEDNVQIGIGSVLFDHVTIGEGSVIGGGSVVTKSIPAGVKAWGNPCKVVGEIQKDHIVKR